MKAIVTASLDDMRIFVGIDGSTTDSQDIAMVYPDRASAELAAIEENMEWHDMGFISTWEAAWLLPDGTITF